MNNITATTVYIQWNCNGNCSVPGFIRGYRLIYDLQSVVPSPSLFLQVVGENNKAVVLKGLRPYSTHHIRVQVMTASGRDGLPSTVWARTQEGGTSKNMGYPRKSRDRTMTFVTSHWLGKDHHLNVNGLNPGLSEARVV